MARLKSVIGYGNDSHPKCADWSPRRRAYRYRHTQNRRRHFRILIQAIKWITPCADCGKQYPPYVMEFDHVRGEKLWNGFTTGATSKARIIRELEKCEIVCSNCHKIRTFGNGDWTSRYRKKDL